MNNNRNQNRRRGRSNRPQGSGGSQMNRIDSRSRGNAVQMLDKFKKLAQDAQHNGDRVQAESYLQYADHYFRVIADNKARQDEQRGKRPDDRDVGNDDDGEEDSFDDNRQTSQPADRGNRNNRGRRYDNRDGADDREDTSDRQNTGNRETEGSEGTEGSEYEPAENPFARDGRDRGGDNRPARSRRRDADGNRGHENEGEIDAAALPPSISDGEEAPPKRKPAPRRRKRDGDEGLKAVG